MTNSSETQHAISVAAFIDSAPFSGMLRRVPVLCGMLMMIEGMDTYGVGYVGPQLAEEYGISPQTLGAIHAVTVIASLIGATVIAPLSDRFGRRKLLIGATMIMAICTLLTCFAGNEAGLIAVRFLIGIGFGAAVPTAFSITSEYAPARHRSVIIMTTMSGIALGMAIAGIAAAFLIPAYGWKSLLLLSGSLSVVWAGLMLFALPESLAFLVAQDPDSPETKRITTALSADRGISAVPRLTVPGRATTRQPWREVLADGRLAATVLLWFAMSMIYSLEFFTSYWLPSILLNSGADMFAAGMISALGKIGSIAGAISIGFTMDRFGAAKVLTLSYLATAAAVLVLGVAKGGAVAALALIFVTFFLLDGSFAGIQALTASSFPSHVRATGIGWVTGISRLLGGGAGTLAGGYVVAFSLPPWEIAAGMATIMVLGATSIIALQSLSPQRISRRQAISVT